MTNRFRAGLEAMRLDRPRGLYWSRKEYHRYVVWNREGEYEANNIKFHQSRWWYSQGTIDRVEKLVHER